MHCADRGLSLVDALIVASVLLLVATVYWPHHNLARVVEREQAVVERIDALRKQLEEHRQAAATDTDGDGRGEYPPLGRVLADGPSGRETSKDSRTAEDAAARGMAWPALDAVDDTQDHARRPRVGTRGLPGHLRGR